MNILCATYVYLISQDAKIAVQWTPDMPKFGFPE